MAARLLMVRPAEALGAALVQQLVGSAPIGRPIALLALTALIGGALAASIAGAVFGTVARGWPLARVAERMRLAPASATVTILPAIGVALALGAEVSATLGVLRSGNEPSLATSALLICVAVTFGSLALFCLLGAQLTLLRLGAADEASGTMGDGALLLGKTVLELLSRPGRALALANAALLVTLPLMLLVWFTLPWSWVSGTGQIGAYPLMLGQALCVSTTAVAVALTMERGLAAPSPAESAPR